MLSNDSSGWVFYTYVSFAVAVLMGIGGVYFMPAALWIKGYLCMAMVLLVSTTFSLAKTVRDSHESQKLHHRIDEAKTERLLSDIEAA